VHFNRDLGYYVNQEFHDFCAQAPELLFDRVVAGIDDFRLQK
jgi:hypothetical protein